MPVDWGCQPVRGWRRPRLKSPAFNTAAPTGTHAAPAGLKPDSAHAESVRFNSRGQRPRITNPKYGSSRWKREIESDPYRVAQHLMVTFRGRCPRLLNRTLPACSPCRARRFPPRAPFTGRGPFPQKVTWLIEEAAPPQHIAERLCLVYLSRLGNLISDSDTGRLCPKADQRKIGTSIISQVGKGGLPPQPLNARLLEGKKERG